MAAENGRLVRGGTGMKNKGKKIEVRFFETAEFHVTPMPAWIDNEDCGDPVE
jgi:hypothetical protein